MARYITVITGEQEVMLPGPSGLLEPHKGLIEKQICLDDWALVFRMPGGHTPSNRALFWRCS